MWPSQIGKTRLVEFVPICHPCFQLKADGGRIPGQGYAEMSAQSFWGMSGVIRHFKSEYVALKLNANSNCVNLTVCNDKI